MLKDHFTLQQLLANLTHGHLGPPLLPNGKSSVVPFIAGPDVANAGYSGGKRYWSDYFSNATDLGQGPGVNYATWHHYYGSGETATTADTHSPAVLDSFISQQQAMAQAMGTSDTAIWLGECGNITCAV